MISVGLRGYDSYEVAALLERPVSEVNRAFMKVLEVTHGQTRNA